MRLVFIGPPGSGKGTQCRRLLNYLEVPHLSTGELLREANARGDSDGQLAEQYMCRGQLAPDPIVMKIVATRLQQPDCQRGFLFDGFPRTLNQARSLDDMLHKASSPLHLVVELLAEEAELMRRMLYRGTVEKRSDDSPATIAQRIEVYKQQTAPVTDYYRQQQLLVAIDAMRPADVVFADIRHAVDQHRSSFS